MVKRAVVILVEGDAEGVRFIVEVFKNYGDGIVEFRKMEVAEEIVIDLVKLRNVIYLLLK